MKKTLILFLVVLFSAPTNAQEQPTVAPAKNVLKLNTLSLFLGTGSIFYERKLTDLASAQFGLGYLTFSITDSKFNGLILTPELRFYVNKNAIDGFYVAPYLRYLNFNFKSKDGSDDGSFTKYGGGVSLGRQWILSKGFVMDLFFGAHYTNGNITTTSGTTPSAVNKFSGFKTRMGFAIGFAF